MKSKLSKIWLLVDGGNEKGIRCRFWFAVLLSVIAIAVDTALVYSNYDYLPRTVPVLSDWDGVVQEWGPKTEFWQYEIQRIILLILCLIVGFLIVLLNPQSIIAKRTKCLLAETAMLIITTGVGISTVQLQLALGDYTQEISDYWEVTIMLGWFALSLVEYGFDVRKLRS